MKLTNDAMNLIKQISRKNGRKGWSYYSCDQSDDVSSVSVYERLLLF